MPQILHPSDKELVELGFEDELDLGNWNFRPYGLSVIFYQNKQKVWLVGGKQIFPESITDIEFLKNLFIQK